MERVLVEGATKMELSSKREMVTLYFLHFFVEIEVSSVFKKNSGVIRSFFY